MLVKDKTAVDRDQLASDKARKIAQQPDHAAGDIFRLLRVDFIWRVTHRDPKPGQEIQNFAVNLGIKLKF